MTDTDTHTEVVDRYFDAWNESDTKAREDLLPAVFTAGGRSVDPQSDVTGPGAIAAMGDPATLEAYVGAGIDRVVVWLPRQDHAAVMTALDQHATTLAERLPAH
jgi:hypothetical protein